jgi:hypothetical protein
MSSFGQRVIDGTTRTGGIAKNHSLAMFLLLIVVVVADVMMQQGEFILIAHIDKDLFNRRYDLVQPRGAQHFHGG